MEALTFSDLVRDLIKDGSTVTVGTSGNELHGVIIAFDLVLHVITYQDLSPGGGLHFIPLSSIRSIGYEDAPDGVYCYVDLFKK
ncbi:MAG: hypothetical protein K6T85_15145 [Gorillibacterium sp.]|nr:hypothetical protein [Gorillibacterium sp.]